MQSITRGRVHLRYWVWKKKWREKKYGWKYKKQSIEMRCKKIITRRKKGDDKVMDEKKYRCGIMHVIKIMLFVNNMNVIGIRKGEIAIS